MLDWTTGRGLEIVGAVDWLGGFRSHYCLPKYDVDAENMKEHRNQEKSPGDRVVMAGVVLEKRPKKMSGCAMTSI